MSRVTRILVIEDHDVMRFGLTQLIGTDPSLSVAGAVSEGGLGLQFLRENPVDVVLVDLTLPDCHGLNLIRQIKRRYAGMTVLVLSMHEELGYAERAFAAGAAGYVTKTAEPQCVLEALRKVAGGGVYVSEAFKERLIKSSSNSGNPPSLSPLDVLSDREIEILRLLGSGLRSSEIAEQLQRSIKTVEAHRENIKRKLALRNASELIRYAVYWFEGEHSMVCGAA